MSHHSDSSSNDARLRQLLLAWQEIRQGKGTTRPEELCVGVPDLIEPLKRQIAAIEEMERVLGQPIRIDRGIATVSMIGPQLSDEATRDYRSRHETYPSVDERTTAAVGGQQVRLAPPGYEILTELGRGGMGIVFKAMQLKAKRLVALKMILSGGYASPSDLARFRIEGESIARLQHANIVQVFDVGDHEGKPYFALEFCEGGSLKDKLAGAPLPPSDAARLAEKLARGIAKAHEKSIVHRDLKPANILLNAVGEPKITDFGLAKQLDDESSANSPELTRTGAVMGTPSYMAPEQASGDAKRVGPTCDVYALGAILYECLTGWPPFRAASLVETLEQVRHREPVPPSQLNPTVPRDLETICLKCLRKEAIHRYASANDLAEDLRRFQAGEPIVARPVGQVERLSKWVKRRPAIAGLLAALIIVTVAGVTGIVWKYIDAEIQRGKAERLAADNEQKRIDAEKQKGIADERTVAARNAEGKAKDEANRANNEEQIARRELVRAEELVYAGNLLQAQLLWEAGNVTAARERLDACRWDYRGFEHALLRHQFNETFVNLDPQAEKNSVSLVCFSPDGKRLACDAHNRVKVWDTETGQLVLTLEGHSNTVTCLTYSPDGQRIASGGGAYDWKLRKWLHGEVRVWDAASGKQLLHFKDQTETVHGLAFSPDGKRIASGSGKIGQKKSGEVKIWDAANGEVLVNVKGRNEWVHCLSFSPDGKRLAVSGGDPVAMVWDAADGKPLFALPKHANTVWWVGFSPDGQRIASVGNEGIIKICNTADGKELLNLGHADGSCRASFSPDGKRIASACDGKSLKIWDTRSGQELLSLKGHTNSVWNVAFSPDGGRLASASSDGTVKIWDTIIGQEPSRFGGNSEVTFRMAFDSDGKRVATGGTTAQIWDTKTGRPMLTVKGNTSQVYDVSFRPDGKRLAGAVYGGRVMVWDCATGKDLLTITQRSMSYGNVCYSPDGKHIAASGGSLSLPVKVVVLGIWDAEKGTEVRMLPGHTEYVSGISYSLDGKQLASTSWDQTAKIWDAASGTTLFTLRGHLGRVSEVCFNNAGTRVATAGEDRTVRVWDTSNGRELLTLQGHTVKVRDVTFTPDGKRLVSADDVGILKAWDASSGRELLSFKGHQGWVNDLVFRPDGQRMLSSGYDKMIKIWDAAIGRDDLFLEATDELAGVGFSADGMLIVARTHNGEVRSWNAFSGQPVIPCTAPPPPDGQMEAFSADDSLHIQIDGSKIRVRRMDEHRPAADLIALPRLNDLSARLRWHRSEAADSESKQQWFAAAFHLRQLINAKEADADKLQVRLDRCEKKINLP